ncbi:MAG: DnaJ domain-containing protein [Bacteroidota bacterium]
MIDYYQLLGISASATDEEIKKAYKRKAVNYHPDKNPDTEDLFKEINNAYQTLSDPYARARYDLKLKYGEAQFTEPTQHRPPPAGGPFYRRRGYRPPPQDRRVMSKENLKATLFAFIFAVAVGSIVMIVITVNDWYQEQVYEEQMAERRATFESAKAAFDQGDYSLTITLLSSLGSVRKGEKDIDEYKTKVIKDIYQEGVVFFETGLYDRALSNFGLIDGYPVTRTIQHQKMIAETYLGAGDTQKALQQLREILTSGVRDIDILLKMADIFKEKMGDYSRALTYYEWGNRIAINDYEAIYGKAYPLLINARVISKKHYELYCGLADAYYKTGEYQRAIDATNWSVQIWPDSAFNYKVMAESALALDKTVLACENFQLAHALDPTLDVPDSCD